jgi:hypothetical protein
MTFIFPAVPDMTSSVAFSVYLKRNYTPSELEGNAVVSYSRPTGKHADLQLYKPHLNYGSCQVQDCVFKDVLFY